MLSKNYWKILCSLPAAFLLASFLVVMSAAAQMAPTLNVTTGPAVKAKKGSTATIAFKATLPPGFHANSNKPTDSYLIPLTLKWTGGPLQAGAITYPKPSQEKYSFSQTPLSVVTGEFTISTSFKVPANAATGAAAENGTLRYQACNDRMCFAPKTVPVTLSLDIE